MRCLVIQSHRSPLPQAWLERCTRSVARWAQLQEHAYEWLGDELFECLPATLRHKTLAQPAIAADLARLRILQQRLAQGFERVVWIDADVLVFDPEALQLSAQDHGFGREVWVQQSGKRLRTYRKIHNAFMHFSADSTTLPFYADTAERILQNYATTSSLPPQVIGPKLLTALHNIAHFNIIESAAMLPPLVAADLYHGRSSALSAMARQSEQKPAAFNLCSSLANEHRALDIEMGHVIDQLLGDGLAWPGISHT